jgi:hypothetical protein
LGRPERIVALSVGLAAPVAIINSTVWAIAVCYMAHTRATVALARLRTHTHGALPETGATPSPATCVAD